MDGGIFVFFENLVQNKQANKLTPLVSESNLVPLKKAKQLQVGKSSVTKILAEYLDMTYAVEDLNGWDGMDGMARELKGAAV